MTSLNERLGRIIEAIVDDYESRPPDDRQRLLHIVVMQGEFFNGWGEDKPPVTRDDLDELQAFGLVDIDFGSSGSYFIRPTTEARQQVRALRRERARLDAPQPVDLSWPEVRPVLHAVVDLWSEAGAPSGGLVGIGGITTRLERETGDLGTVRAVELLAANDWLVAEYDEDTDVLAAQPTLRGVMATRAWPGGDGEVAAERFLAALDEIAETSPDPEKRGWAGRMRETVMEVGTRTLAEVVSKSVGSAV